jgi:hypothetical protein
MIGKILNSMIKNLAFFLILFVFGLIVLGAKCQSVSSSESNNSVHPAVTSPTITTVDSNRRIGIIDNDFEKNKRLWANSKISNYDMVVSLTVTSFTNPAEPVLIKVRAGKLISIKQLNYDDYRSLQYYEGIDTIDKMFDRIKNSIEYGGDYKVKYNSEFGYPEEITTLLGSSASNIKIKDFDVVSPGSESSIAVKAAAQENINKLAESNKFEKNRKLWAESKISNYNMTVNIITITQNETAGPVLIKVRAGKPISIELLTKSDNRSVEPYNNYDTIEKIFDNIEEKIEKGDRITVEYNKKLGYPVSITFTIENTNDVPNIRITKFEVVK